MKSVDFKIGDKVKNSKFKGEVVGTPKSCGHLHVIITHNPNNNWTDNCDWANGKPCWAGYGNWIIDKIDNWRNELE